MYRVPAPPDAEVPCELEYPLANSDRADKPSIALFQLFALPPLVALFLASIAPPPVALAGMVVVAVGLVLWWRRPRDVLVLRVEDGELTVALRGAKAPKARMRLDALTDVVLDTKTIRQHQESASPIVGMRFADSRVGPETDRARIVLVSEDESVPLDEAYGAHLEASEQFAKIRVFLRKHGWLPEDEREEPSSE